MRMIVAVAAVIGLGAFELGAASHWYRNLGAVAPQTAGAAQVALITRSMENACKLARKASAQFLEHAKATSDHIANVTIALLVAACGSPGGSAPPPFIVSSTAPEARAATGRPR